jgi:hypothetical protein
VVDKERRFESHLQEQRLNPFSASSHTQPRLDRHFEIGGEARIGALHTIRYSR